MMKTALMKLLRARLRFTYVLIFATSVVWFAIFLFLVERRGVSLEESATTQGVQSVEVLSAHSSIIGTGNYTKRQTTSHVEEESNALPFQHVVGWKRCRQTACSKSETCDSSNSTGTEMCCSLVLRDLLVALQSFLTEKHNVDFYIMFGTLLGAQREADFIKWSSDLDIAVEAESINVLERIHEWNTKYYFWMENKHIGRMCITDYSDPNAKTWGAWDKIPTYVDVYVPKQVPHNESRFQESKTIFPVVPPCIFNTKDIYGDGASNKQLIIDGLTVNAPADTMNVLKHIYGENWNEPDRQRSAHGVRPCEHDNQGHFNELVARANVMTS